MTDAWFKFYASDWLSGTVALSPAEKGVYITLIAAMYDAGGSIPNEPRRLARLTGASNSLLKRAVEALLDDGKLELDEQGHLTNARVQQEVHDRILRRENARVAGEKSQEKQRSGAKSAQRPSSGSGAKTPKGTRLPGDWEPSAEDWNYAAQQGLRAEEIEHEHQNFRDYWIAKPGAGGVKLDWAATWRTWVRRSAERRRGSGGASPARSAGGGQRPGGGSLADAAARLVSQAHR